MQGDFRANLMRVLNHEKRLLVQSHQRDAVATERLENLRSQVEHLTNRARHVKNVILATYAAIVSFLATSILIFLNVYANFELYPIIILVFLVGLLLILIASIMEIIEANIAFTVIRIESHS